jgi:hypothetical protein
MSHHPILSVVQWSQNDNKSWEMIDNFREMNDNSLQMIDTFREMIDKSQEMIETKNTQATRVFSASPIAINKQLASQ